MNFLAIVQRLKRESGRSTSSAASPASFAAATADDNRLIDWVADAWLEILREPYLWRWRRLTADLVSVVIGKRNYTASDLGLAGQIWRLKRPSMYYAPTMLIDGQTGTEWALEWLEYDEYRARYVATTVGDAQPLHWTVSPTEELLVGPAPSVAYKLRFDYYAAATPLALEADAPDMPAEYHPLLVWRALLDVAAFDAAPEVYTRAANNYRKMMGALIRDEAEDLGFELGSMA